MAERKRHAGMFKPGNPGKPRGARNKRTKYVEAVGDDFFKIIDTMVRMAIDGDVQAANWVGNRIWPVFAERESEMLAHIDELRARLEKASKGK